MAEALIKGMVRAGKKNIVVSEPREEQRNYLEKTYGIETTPDNRQAVSKSDIIILAVKPGQMAAVLDEMAGAVTEQKTVVSIAAGITLSFIKERLKTERLIRAMPNLAATVGEGMTALALCECFTGRDIDTVKEIFMSVGRVMMMPEKYMDAVTALSGSGPAFMALFVDSMVNSAVEMGLSEKDALELAVQTATGTAKLLDGGISPEKLIAMVKSPGGTTEAGLKVFEEKGLKAIVKDALLAAKRRAEELAR